MVNYGKFILTPMLSEGISVLLVQPIQVKMSKSGREYFRLGSESYSSLGSVGKKEKKIACPLLDVFACGQVSSRRRYRLKSYMIKISALKVFSSITKKFLATTAYRYYIAHCFGKFLEIILKLFSSLQSRNCLNCHFEKLS